MPRKTSLLIALGVGLLMTQGASAANITLCGASPGGLWSLIGAGVDAAVRELDPSSTVTYQTSSGGFANIAQLKAGSCDIGIVHAGEALIAKKGDAPFDAPVEGIEALALVYDKAPMHFLMTKAFADEYKLSSVTDLAKGDIPLNLVSNRRGILPAILLEKSLNQVDVEYDKIEADGGSIQYEGSSSAAEIMQNGRADMWVNATFIGTSAVKTIAESRDVRLLSVPEDVVQYMIDNYGSQAVTIPAGGYPWVKEDVKTFGARAALVVSADADPEMVTLVATAVHEHADKVAGVHKAMSGFTSEFAASLDVLPYNPVAAKIYGISAE